MDVKGPRMTVEFSPEQHQDMLRMADAMDTSKAGVIRTALALLALAVTESSRGNDLAVVSGDRVQKQIVGLWRKPRSA